MISKTILSKRIAQKRNPILVETLKLCKHNPKWFAIGTMLGRSRKDILQINLDVIDKQTKEGDTIVVPGKVLAQGTVSKKIRVVALQFSENAKEKLKIQKAEAVSLLDEIQKNAKAEGIKLIQT